MIATRDYALYLVTDDPSRYKGDFVAAVEAAVDGGVTMVQYRDTESCGRVLYERALRLQRMLRERRIPLIVNNFADLAMAVEADGVHLGQSDMPPAAVRRVVGSRMTIGLSVTSSADVATVSDKLVDYVGIGPVFDATQTKRDAAPELGVKGFSKIRRALAKFPAVAIGGINLERAASVYAAGADGLAVVSAFSRSDSPYDVACCFCEVFGKRTKK